MKLLPQVEGDLMIKLAVDARNLVFNFKTVKAVEDFSLEVPRGTVFGLLGPQGAGKTTVIRLLLGLIKPKSGSSEVMGFDSKTEGEKIRRCTAVLSNPPELYESLKVESNMQFYAWARHLETLERDEMTEELLNRFGLWERRKFIVEFMNRQDKQLLGLATVFLHHHALIFLDEPTAGFDPITAMKLREHLASLISSKRATVFLGTDSQSEAKRLCDQVGLVFEGRLLRTGRPEELGLQEGIIQVRMMGEGFNEQLLAILKEQPGVAAIDLQENCLTLTLNKATDSISSLVSLIKVGGAIISEPRWEEVYPNKLFPEKESGPKSPLDPVIPLGP
jgi:ABC-2 type transport system ATP-binding protein